MIQFITHYTDTIGYVDSVRIALEGGCRWIQLRMKGADVEEVQRTAMQVSAMCAEVGATFIIDDHVELVNQTGASGVHLGKSDMPVAEARKMLGADCIIGGTANTIDDVVNLYEAGADYIGCGPFRFTTTKTNLSPVLGLDGYRDIVNEMKVRGIDLPIVAIGGITADDIPGIMSTGVTGIALSGSVLRADNPVMEMRRLLGIMNNA